MKVNSYRLEIEDKNGRFCGCSHFKTLEEAEIELKRHGFLEEYLNNIIPSTKRYGTIWESDLEIKLGSI